MTASQPTYSPTYAQDRAEIEDLMARYLFAIDYADYEAYGETFTEDAELEYARGTAKGREAIKDSIRTFKEKIGQIYTTEDGKPATLRHVLLQAVIRVEGDNAWTTSLWMEMANNGPGDTMKMGTFGIYEDELVRQGGRWLFSRRRILNEFLAGRHSGPGNPVRNMDALAAALLASQ
ncbi:MAG: nuclear transport factor 2 family protein [Sphingomonas sp.]|nr:nuclear transport factor 2 family protein [Sphingomonas sp.]